MSSRLFALYLSAHKDWQLLVLVLLDVCNELHLCYDLVNLDYTSFIYSKYSILLCFMVHMLGFNTPHAIQLYLFCTSLFFLHSDHML